MDTRQIFDDVLEAIGGEVYADELVQDARDVSPEGTLFTVLLDVENYTFEELDEMVEKGEFVKKLKDLEDSDDEPMKIIDAYKYFVGETNNYPDFPGVEVTIDADAYRDGVTEYPETDRYLERNNVDYSDVVLFEMK
mgnify:FL=1